MVDTRSPGTRRAGEQALISSSRRSMMFRESKQFVIKLVTQPQGGGAYTNALFRIYQGRTQIGGEYNGTGTVSIDSAAGDVRITGSSTRTGRSYILSVDDRVVSSKSVGYSQPFTTLIPIQLLFPPKQSSIPKIQAEQKPRYLLKSPVQNGSYTESVSFLTSRQVADFRNRGFIVENTTRAITPAIKVSGNPNITTIDNVRRLPRKGIVDNYSRFLRRDVISVVNRGRQKSEINPRKIFAENPFRATQFTNRLTAHLKNRINTAPSSVGRNSVNQAAANRAYANYNSMAIARNRALAAADRKIAVAKREAAAALALAKKTGVTNVNRYTESPDSTKRYSYSVFYPSGYVLTRTNVSSIVYAGDRGGNGRLRGVQGHKIGMVGSIPGDTSTLPAGIQSDMNTVQGTQKINAESQSMKQELINLKAWLQEVNSRLSGQVVDLGQSTTDRDRQIQDLAAWTTKMNERISKQLIDLGQASTDASKAIEISKAKHVVDTVKAEQEPGIWDRISGGIEWLEKGLTWDNLKKYSLIGVALLVLIIVLKFGMGRITR